MLVEDACSSRRGGEPSLGVLAGHYDGDTRRSRALSNVMGPPHHDSRWRLQRRLRRSSLPRLLLDDVVDLCPGVRRYPLTPLLQVRPAVAEMEQALPPPGRVQPAPGAGQARARREASSGMVPGSGDDGAPTAAAPPATKAAAPPAGGAHLEWLWRRKFPIGNFISAQEEERKSYPFNHFWI